MIVGKQVVIVFSKVISDLRLNLYDTNAILLNPLFFLLSVRVDLNYFYPVYIVPFLSTSFLDLNFSGMPGRS